MKTSLSFMVLLCVVMTSTQAIAEARAPQLVISAFVEALRNDDIEYLEKYVDLEKISQQPKHGYTVETLTELFADVQAREVELSKPLYDSKTEIVRVSMIKPLAIDFELQHQNAVKGKGDFYRIVGMASSPANESVIFAGLNEPGTTPELFAPGQISTDAYEFAITFMPDMSELYLTRRKDPGPNRIVMAHVVDGEIQPTTRASFSQGNGQFEPCVAPDGAAIYFGVEDKIVVSRLVDGEWSAPEELPEAVNGGFAMAIGVDAEGDLYFTGSNGIMVAKRAGNELLAAESLGPHFARSAGGSAHGYIAPDGDLIIFDSQGRNDGKGRSDLYVSFKTDDSEWSEPRNLSALNTEATEMCASLSPDGRFLFYSRDGNIWWVSATVLDGYR